IAERFGVLRFRLMGSVSSNPVRMIPITGIAGCCARAASGHATAAPPSSVIKSRRFTARCPPCFRQQDSTPQYGKRLLRCGISGRIRCSGLDHGTEGDRIARGVDRRDAVLPDMAGGAGHHVERAWLRVERETFPLVADLAAETEFAGRGEGEPEYL